MKASWLFSLGQGCKHRGSSCWTCTLANKKPAYVSPQAIHVAGIQLHGMPIWPLLQLCCPHSTLRALLSWVLLPGWSFLSITTWWVVLCEHQCLHLLVSWQQDSFKKCLLFHQYSCFCCFLVIKATELVLLVLLECIHSKDKKVVSPPACVTEWDTFIEHWEGSGYQHTMQAAWFPLIALLCIRNNSFLEKNSRSLMDN